METVERLAHALAKLSSEERQVIQLRQENFPWNQIAERMSLTVNRCRFLQQRAYQALQAELRQTT